MPTKKVDNRIRTLIENAVEQRQRCLMVVVGDRGRDQVVNLHYMMSKAQVKARPSVLWCYNKELGFSTHKQKRMKEVKKLQRKGVYNSDRDDPFELFITSTQIRWCYYKDTDKILGQTYGMLVLQDFEALTPNLLCRTIETVEGGGMVVLLLKTMTSLKQLYTMAMDVHDRFRTEAHQDVVARFNERFLLSLTKCSNSLVVDDELNILPISRNAKDIKSVKNSEEKTASTKEKELQDLKASMEDVEMVGGLVAKAKTLDQAKCVMTNAEAISEKTLRSTVVITAARGRGKSAALGLSIAAAIGFGYSNVFVTSPAPENLKTLFEFVFKGFEALEYKEHIDYEAVASTRPELSKAIIRVNIFRNQRQTIQYIDPSDADKLTTAELVVIDEAAAIPLPVVKRLLGPYLVFMSSTINGYEGTGRSLSLKLVQQLRQEQASTQNGNSSSGTSSRTLREVSLEQPIRYAPDDPIERWLHDLLCLDAAEPYRLVTGLPAPSECELYLVDRDALFSGHKISEAFLHRMMSLYVASHYKNTPNDLQLMSDAPAHRLFALVGPVNHDEPNSIPDILCVIQVCLEGHISKGSVQSSLKRGYRSSGDLIPWTISQQFQDSDFPQLSGARIVRIATHPDATRMGYGKKAMQNLVQYFQGDITPSENAAKGEQELEDSKSGKILAPGGKELEIPKESMLSEEKLKPRKHLPPLMVSLMDAPTVRLHWIGVSFGLTLPLFRFWRKANFVPVYLRQTANELTGEHTAIMLRALKADDLEEGPAPGWEQRFASDFARRYLSLLSYAFRHFDSPTALSVIDAATGGIQKYAEGSPEEISEADKNAVQEWTSLSAQELNLTFTMHDIQRLESYARNLVDYHMITDLLPTLSRIYFLVRLPGINMSRLQSCVLLGLGLQHRSIDEIATELNVPATQLLALFNKAVKKLVNKLKEIQEAEIERTIDKGSASKEDKQGEKAAGREEAVENLGLGQYRVNLDDEKLSKIDKSLQHAAETGGLVSVPVDAKDANTVTPEKRKNKEHKGSEGKRRSSSKASKGKSKKQKPNK
eukprot:gb/GECG01000678.1/.p1 GENE.gb/GECG01000678.1/~~gb/GECG01000678.1/.p1  ORF type:complete len:1048 (+),score=154.62 gb/GECG01000678.1/:1-3144(+)